jgi:hypothetical protein
LKFNKRGLADNDKMQELEGIYMNPRVFNRDSHEVNVSSQIKDIRHIMNVPS